MTETARLHSEVAEFAAAVRARLSDLSPDEIEELTGDLEADLQERLDETGAELDDPAAYATELRAAAGLPPREVRDSRPWYEKLRAAIERRGTRLDERLRSNQTALAAMDFAVALRPVWWVLRAWIAYQLAHLFIASNNAEGVLPDSPYVWVALIVATVVSVQWGRGRWRDRRWLPAVATVGSVVAVIGAPIAISHASDSASGGTPISTRPVAHHRDHGLRMNGRPIRNVFAYDLKGNPLELVQLYDQRGKPLRVTRRESLRWVSIPATLRTGQPAWNAFPLSRIRWRDTLVDQASGRRVAKPGTAPQAWELPLPHAPAITAAPTDGGKDDKSDKAKQEDGAKPDEKKSADDSSQGRSRDLGSS